MPHTPPPLDRPTFRDNPALRSAVIALRRQYADLYALTPARFRALTPAALAIGIREGDFPHVTPDYIGRLVRAQEIRTGHATDPDDADPDYDNPDDTAQLITRDEAARIIGVSPATLYRWQEQGRINLKAVVKAGARMRLYRRQDAERVARERQGEAAAAIPTTPEPQLISYAEAASIIGATAGQLNMWRRRGYITIARVTTAPIRYDRARFIAEAAKLPGRLRRSGIAADMLRSYDVERALARLSPEGSDTTNEPASTAADGNTMP